MQVDSRKVLIPPAFDAFEIVIRVETEDEAQKLHQFFGGFSNTRMYPITKYIFDEVAKYVSRDWTGYPGTSHS